MRCEVTAAEEYREVGISAQTSDFPRTAISELLLRLPFPILIRYAQHYGWRVFVPQAMPTGVLWVSNRVALKQQPEARIHQQERTFH